MTLTVEIPDVAAPALQESFGEMSRAMIESFAVEGYRSGRISAFTAGQLLGHGSRWETQEFLADHNAWPGQTVAELDRELDGLASVQYP